MKFQKKMNRTVERVNEPANKQSGQINKEANRQLFANLCSECISFA